MVVATRGNGSKAPSGMSAASCPRADLLDDAPSAAYQDAVQRWEDRGGHIIAGVADPSRASPLSAGGVRKTRRQRRARAPRRAGRWVPSSYTSSRGDPATRFVVLDPDPINTSTVYTRWRANPNTSDGFFIEGPGARLAGFVGALMAQKQGSGKRPVVISQILVNKSVSANVITNSPTGARAAVSTVKVVTRYAGKSAPSSRCEAIANAQIEQGSRVVYADAGSACSVGALSGCPRPSCSLGNRSRPGPSNPFGPRILGYTVKNIPAEVGWVIRNYLAGTLPRRPPLGCRHRAWHGRIRPL